MSAYGRLFWKVEFSAEESQGPQVDVAYGKYIEFGLLRKF